MSQSQSCCCGDTAETESQSCCCGDVDSSSTYSCADDAYTGHMKTIVLDFLFLDLTMCDRCQGADERVYQAIERCCPVLQACGFNLVLNQVNIDDEQLAERFDFYSSPTIRVNGVDLCPSIEENDCDCCSDISDSDVKCRLFPFNNTHYEVPPTDMIVKHIMEVALQGKYAAVGVEPYNLPDNLKDFFEGKRSKSAQKASSGSSSSCCC